MNQDLTVGKPQKVLWAFCLPLFGSILFQQLYTIADSLVAGKFIGEDALAAVGNGYEITLVFLAFAIGCNVGCSVVVARLFGAARYGDLKTAVYTTLLSCAALCGALMLLGFVFCKSLLLAIRTPESLLADSSLYLYIYIGSLPFVFFYNVATGIFSALGDSKTPFYFLAASSLANIGMDVLFVKTFQMGVAGVAWATFLCQGVSCILGVVCVFYKLSRIPAAEKPSVFSKSILRDIAAIAVPSILQQSFISVGNVVIQGVINPFGPSVMAGYAAAVKYNNLVITSFTTISNGVSNFTAQNMGAGKPERVAKGFWAGLTLVFSITLVFTALYCSIPQYLLRLFTNESTTEAAVSEGTRILRIFSPFYCVIALKLAADGILRGTGRMRYFMIATFTDLTLRVALAVVLSSTALGSLGIWLAWPLGWIVAAVLSVLFYQKVNRTITRPARAALKS